MNPFRFLADWFRARERKAQTAMWAQMRAEEQERCPHKRKVIDALDDVKCVDCGADLSE